MTSWVTGIIGGSLGIAVVLAGGVVVHRGKKLCAAAPKPSWSFDSWASNLSVFGAVLGASLAGVFLPSNAAPLHADTFAALAAYFGFLTVIGPFVFRCARPWTSRADGTTGSKVGLLAACSVALAAVIGQLATLGLLFWETFSGGAPGVLIAVVAGLCCGLAAYYYVASVMELTRPDKQLFLDHQPGWTLL
jgi:hypothetical protein